MNTEHALTGSAGSPPLGGEDELDLCYMSISTLKAQMERLEQENKELRQQVRTLQREAVEPHPASPGWSGDPGSEYSSGIGGRRGY